MADNFVEFAKGQMGAVERLLKGLPGISGYVDKDMRRDADKRVRDAIAASLAQSQAALTAVQNALLKGGGLAMMDEVNDVAVNLQTLADRIKTASYGYAGLFDAARIKEQQIDALVRFDRAMAVEVGAIDASIAALAQAVKERTDVEAAIEQLGAKVQEMNLLFSKRSEAVQAPGLLDEPGFAPPPVDLPATGG
mgnify:CR=1 FL=1|jgi:hypothetical protein